MYNIDKCIDSFFNYGSTKFLDLKEQRLVSSNLSSKKYKVYKPYKDSEKVIFYKDSPYNVILYELKTLGNLTHQQILGTLFSLGIDQSMYGDILIIDGRYFVYILESIEEYLLLYFSSVANNKIELIKCDIDLLKDYEREYEEIKIISSSSRIDTVVAHLINSNRESASDMIKDKLVLVNNDNVRHTYVLKNGDIFSIRRFGKYKFDDVITETRKGNFIYRILKYK